MILKLFHIFLFVLNQLLVFSMLWASQAVLLLTIETLRYMKLDFWKLMIEIKKIVALCFY